jgi:hypothetical protein
MPEITKQDVLRWLEMQRDAINTEIAYAAPSDKAQYFGNLRAVNWLVDRVKDLSAVEYAKAHDEICDAYEHCLCASCPLGGHCITLVPYGTDIKPAVEIVKRWKEKHNDV